MTKILLMGLPIERYAQPMLGLGYVGASLLKHGYEVKIHDASSHGFGQLQQIEKEIKTFMPGYVGVSALTAQVSDAVNVLRLTKKINPEIVTFMGGPHVSALPEWTLKTIEENDYVFIGESEISLPKFITAHSKNGRLESISGIAYRINNGFMVNKPEVIKDISSLEWPWKVLNPLSYKKSEVHGYTCKRRPIVSVISSRGCPYQCIFCAQSSVFGSSLRVRDPIEFVDELEYLHLNFGVREFHFADDNFTFYRDHAEKVCKEILKRGLNIDWALINGIRADRVDSDLLKLMKKAGCYYMAFGIESGSPRTLRTFKKALNIEKDCESVKIANKLGFITQGFFLIGAPFETTEDINLTVKLIKLLPLDRVAVGVPIPFPGSELFDYYLKRVFKNLDNVNWDEFKWGKFKPFWENLSGDIVASKLREAFLSVFMNPLRMLKFVMKLKTLEQYKTTFAGFRQWFTHVFDKIERIK